MPVDSTPPCHPEACKIQDCLQANTYQQEKCNGVIKKLYECCEQLYAKDDKADVPSCPMPHIVKRKLKDLS